ncbi:MAG: radical SAM protein [Hyphomicrobium sp.]|jgi:radical SAM superfamily enzyme YgiQ (UPF0313 family)
MLKGYLNDRTDHEVTVRDLNIEWLHYMFEAGSLTRAQGVIEGRLAELENKSRLEPMEQFAYTRLLQPIAMPTASVLAEAVSILQSGDRFYDVDEYFDAMTALKQWERAMSRISFPGVFDKFSRYGMGPFLNPTSAADIVCATSDAQLGFFSSFLDERVLPGMSKVPPDVVGISIPFRFQLWHAVALARALRARFPATKLVVGGTALQLQKYAQLHGRHDGLYEFFKLFDAVVVGEGEEPLCELLALWERGGTVSRALPQAGKGATTTMPNVLVVDPHRPIVYAPPSFRYHDLNALSVPDYSDVRWDLYLSPEPVLTYSPTRGCYWDRCTFCEIGLATDRPTAPSRERTPDRVIEDLKVLRKIGRHIYWSVDAIRPAWLVQVSRGIAAAGLDVLWGAEVRLDRMYTDEEVAVLKKGGCLAISVGLETGSNRLLKLMDKGTTTERYGTTLARLRSAGIGVYPMTFIGFPTETIDEANQTIDFLEQHADELAMLAMPATFYLEGNAIITQKPEQYSLRRLERFKNLDAPNGWYWEGPERWPIGEQRQLMARLVETSTQIMGLLDRPFLGGVDTPHSALYLERHGLTAIKTASARFKSRVKERPALASRNRVASPFDLEEIRANVWRLIDLLEEEYREGLCASGEITVPLLASLPSVARQQVRYQDLDADIQTPLDQWLDINFSRDRSRDEPMYTQYRPAAHSGAEVVRSS